MSVQRVALDAEEGNTAKTLMGQSTKQYMGIDTAQIVMRGWKDEKRNIYRRNNGRNAKKRIA